jgi:hypothetical protein
MHVDCNVYSSTRDIFDRCGAKNIPGTFILFDEYFDFPEAAELEHGAFKEFLRTSGRRLRYMYYHRPGGRLTGRVVARMVCSIQWCSLSIDRRSGLRTIESKSPLRDSWARRFDSSLLKP